MSSKNTPLGPDKVRFSIGAKLITIISVILIISLGSFTVLVSWLVQADLRVSAEENNFEINRRSTLEVDIMLENTRSSSRTLIQTITALGPTQAMAGIIRQTTDFFFAENPQIISIYFDVPGRSGQVLNNRRFFQSVDMDESLAASFFAGQKEPLESAGNGETLLRNAAPHFSRPFLALFFPCQGGGAGGALFSADSINDNFKSGINKSWMENNNGDILIASDLNLVKEETNISDEDGDTDLLQRYFRRFMRLFLRSDPSLLTASAKLTAADAAVITGIKYDKVFEGIDAVTKRNIYLTICALCISIIIIWLFSRTISIPVKALTGAVRQIENGVFKPELEEGSGDEIGVLTGSFKKMCSSLSIFGSFKDREVAVKLMRGEIKPEGLQKTATIFFSDICEFAANADGFSKFYGAEASEKIVQWLNSYFSGMIECVEKTNGVVDKFIGDTLMAHWGAAYSSGSPRKDAFNGIKAALMMRKALFFFNKRRRAGSAGNPPIRIGCGINSGIVTAGQIGNDTRKEYTVIGKPVSLASRLKCLSKSFDADILISEETWMLAGDRFICEEMPPVTIEGKPKPLRTFAVINFSGEMKGPQSLADVRALF